MRRGEVWWADLPEPVKPRPVLILTRDAAIPVRGQLTVAFVTRRARRLPVEVPLGPEDGLRVPCVVNCDVIHTVPKRALQRRLGRLSFEKLGAAERALRFALGLD